MAGALVPVAVPLVLRPALILAAVSAHADREHRGRRRRAGGCGHGAVGRGDGTDRQRLDPRPAVERA